MTYLAPALFLAFLAVAAITDVTRRKIYNWTVIALVIVYCGAAIAGAAPTGPWSALGAAAVAFALTYGLYHFNVLGAGDAKLFTAAALFGGLTWLLPLAVITALVGGVLAVGYLIARPRSLMRGLTVRGRTEAAATGGVPYGVAIALAAASVGLLSGFVDFP